MCLIIQFGEAKWCLCNILPVYGHVGVCHCCFFLVKCHGSLNLYDNYVPHTKGEEDLLVSVQIQLVLASMSVLASQFL